MLDNNKKSFSLDELSKVDGAFAKGKQYLCTKGNSNLYDKGSNYHTNGEGIVDNWDDGSLTSACIYGDDVLFQLIENEEYTPKVGEECLHKGTLCVPLIVEPDVDNMVVVKIKGEYVVVTNNSFSKLPEYTEQELLAYELYCEINGNFHTLEEIKNYTCFDKYLKVAESGRFK